VAAGAGAAIHDPRLRRALVLALGGALVAMAFPTVLGSWLYARFLAFTVPGVALLLGAGACALGRRAWWMGAAAAAGACGAWLASLGAIGPRQPLREAVDFVVRSRQPGESAFAVGLPDDVHRWYAGLAGVEMPGSGPYGRDLSSRLADPGMRWCVLLYPRALAAQRERLHDAGFEEARVLPGWIDQGDGAVVVLRRR
jgi:hypothetical protein